MTKEQAKEIKRLKKVLGILDKGNDKLKQLEAFFEQEIDEMTLEEENARPNFVNLYVEITDDTIRLDVIIESTTYLLKLVNAEQ